MKGQNPKMPKIIQTRETFDVLSPDGKIAAIFFNEQFLEQTCQKMFDLDPFESFRNYVTTDDAPQEKN